MSDKFFDGIAVFGIILGTILLSGAIYYIDDLVRCVFLSILSVIFYYISYLYFFGVYKL